MILKDKFSDDFIKLFISGITNRVFKLGDIDVINIYKLAKYHSVSNIIYYGLKNHNLEIPEQLKKENFILLHKMTTQECEKEVVVEEFKKNNIKFILVKGSILRDYYPNPELREMADLDVLVEDDELKKVDFILKDLGYEFEGKTYCHLGYVKKPFMNIEVHRRLFEESNVVSKYYDQIWQKAISKADSSEYILSNEEMYMYLITHSAKHFNNGGTGIRILADLYLFNQRHQLNIEYMNEYLKKYKLDKYFTIIHQLSLKIFACQDLTENDVIILKYLLNSGTYGTTAQHNRIRMTDSEENLENKKKRRLFSRLFPSYSMMKRRNPLLKKIPILLPWFWLTRLAKGFFNFEKTKNEYDIIMNTKDEDIEFVRKVKKITKVSEKINEE